MGCVIQLLVQLLLESEDHLEDILESEADWGLSPANIALYLRLVRDIQLLWTFVAEINFYLIVAATVVIIFVVVEAEQLVRHSDIHYNLLDGLDEDLDHHEQNRIKPS